MKTLIRIALAFGLSCSLQIQAATPPKPNTHTVKINGVNKTFANLPGPPVVNDVTTAYQFRTRIIMSPACTPYADKADAIFLSSTLSDEDKAAALEQIGKSAAGSNCLTP